MRCCIVNVAVGGWYPKGQDRMVRTSIEAGYAGEFALWKSLPAGAPTHQENNYAFKAYAMREVAARDYDAILWVDASDFAIRNPQILFDVIQRDGYLFIENTGWNNGQWCTDAALDIFGYTRERMLQMKHCTSMIWGVRRSHFGVIERWYSMALRGAFHGPWTNGPVASDHRTGFCSAHPEVRGHRHDQTALSVIIHEGGYPMYPLGRYLDYDAYGRSEEVLRENEVVYLSRGM